MCSAMPRIVSMFVCMCLYYNHSWWIYILNTVVLFERYSVVNSQAP